MNRAPIYLPLLLASTLVSCSTTAPPTRVDVDAMERRQQEMFGKFGQPMPDELD